MVDHKQMINADNAQPPSTPPEEPTAQALRRHMVVGGSWMVAMRWAIRGIGLVSTIVLARLLTPEDFGIVALAMLVVGIIETLAESGQLLALIRHPRPTREHFDTVWTVGLLIGLALCLMIIAAAEIGRLWVDDPRVIDAILILSLKPLIGGIENVGVVLFRREFDFAKEFRFNVWKKVATFVLTMVLAVTLRDYRALLGGIVGGAAFGVLLSFVMHPYRPRLSLARLRDIWSFSIWILVGTLGAFLQSRLDLYVASAATTPEGVGRYTVAMDVATMPTAEIVLPLSRAFFPAYARLSGNPGELRRAFLDAMAVVAVLCCACGVGLALVAHDLVLVLLGAQWREAAPLVAWQSLAAGLHVYATTGLVLLQAAGHEKLSATQSWSRNLIMLPCLVAAALLGDLEDIAAARFIATALFVPAFLHSITRVLPISYRDFAVVTWRPLLAAGAMSLALLTLPEAALPGSPALRLCFLVPFGAVIFAGVLLFLWQVAGRPAGAERAAVAFAAARLRRASRA